MLLRFGMIFLVFTVVTLLIAGGTTYVNQTRIYQEQQEKNLQNIAEYLSIVLQTDSMDFAAYQRFFLQHSQEMRVPANFGDAELAASKERFESLFAETYPGRVPGDDIAIEDLTPPVQEAYGVYCHEHFLQLFEKATQAFGLEYAYYIVPGEEELHMIYLLDAIREEVLIDGKPYITLGIDVLEPLEEHARMWEAWNTGMAPSGYDTYDNEFGKTYAWYSPVYLNGEKLGLIGLDVEIADYNRAIAANTARQLISIAAVLLLTEAIMLWVINRFYLSKLRHLAESIAHYASNKDASIAGKIERNMLGHDEICTLGSQTAMMILELDNYMKNLVETTDALSNMSQLAKKDALTGVRNRLAYEEELKRLTWRLADGYTEFGVAVADINFLKRINDTYGHEQGNVTIKKSCKLICSVFTHSPVFRIGGDEFAVILENDDYRNIRELVRRFNDSIDALQKDDRLEIWERCSVAIGYALFDPQKDDSVSNIFKRADKAMYARKVEMKALR